MKLIAFLFLFHTLNASENNSKTLDVGVSDVPPISFIKNGELVGVNIDLIKQLEKDSDMSFNLMLLPHARVRKSLESAGPDLLIIFKVLCEKYSEHYEMNEIPLYTLPPVIHLKKSTKSKNKDMRIAKVNGTCMGLNKFHFKAQNIIDVTGMDQAFLMLKANRIDGICGNDPVFEYSLKKYPDLKNTMFSYKVVGNPDDYSAVICSKKSLPESVKNKIQKAANKLTVPDYKKYL